MHCKLLSFIFRFHFSFFFRISQDYPFETTNDILQDKLHFGRDWNYVNLQIKDLITKLLCFDPQKRLSATQVLQHSWLLSEKH